MPEQVITDRGTDGASVSCGSAVVPASSRPAMSDTVVSPLAFPRSPRGIYYEMYHGHRVYRARCADGRWLNMIGVPIGLETEAEVICRLWVALSIVDPLPPSSRPVGRSGSCRGARRPARSEASPVRHGLRLIAP
jgi:hypothetical protein